MTGLGQTHHLCPAGDDQSLRRSRRRTRSNGSRRACGSRRSGSGQSVIVSSSNSNELATPRMPPRSMPPRWTTLVGSSARRSNERGPYGERAQVWPPPTKRGAARRRASSSWRPGRRPTGGVTTPRRRGPGCSVRAVSSRRSFWAWGLESEEPTDADRARRAEYLSKRFGVSITPRPVPRLGDAVLRPPSGRRARRARRGVHDRDVGAGVPLPRRPPDRPHRRLQPALPEPDRRGRPSRARRPSWWPCWTGARRTT